MDKEIARGSGAPAAKVLSGVRPGGGPPTGAGLFGVAPSLQVVSAKKVSGTTLS
jgi:hypothetical protein